MALQNSVSGSNTNEALFDIRCLYLQNRLGDGAQATRARALCIGEDGDGLACIGCEVNSDVAELELLLVLPQEGVRWLYENADKLFYSQLASRHNDGQAADKLGDHS